METQYDLILFMCNVKQLLGHRFKLLLNKRLTCGSSFCWWRGIGSDSITLGGQGVRDGGGLSGDGVGGAASYV